MNEVETKSMEHDPDLYRTLLESTNAIPWKIDWPSLQFMYIGPQIERLLGWPQQSWKSIEDWASRIHEDDREKTVNFCVSQCEAGQDHEADYRALTAAGDYVWIRDVVHVVRDADGEVDALVGFMFDISERKKTEQELVRLKKEMEDLSYRDGLTGVGNRRQFDEILETEWNHVRRHRQPISLLLVDIDYFKQYNDHYGHLQGDECLKQVAKLLSSAVKRPRDFVGRFGGEEFVLVLPETDNKAAQVVAERCVQLLQEQQIAHASSPDTSCLTISLGVATIIPSQQDSSRDLVATADRLLYKAKQAGRNQLVTE